MSHQEEPSGEGTRRGVTGPSSRRSVTRSGLRAARRGVALLPPVMAGALAWRTVSTMAALRRPGPGREDVPVPSPSVGVAAAVAVDSLITMPIGLVSSVGSTAHYQRSSAELDAAVAFYDRRGWLDDPAGRHPAPAEVPTVEMRRSGRDGLERVRFESGWAPVDGEPGSERWTGFAENRTVPVGLLRHADGPRPWLVAIHGQGMGRPSDQRMLRVRRLHEELGLNVALPVLPLHGPRSPGSRPDQQFVSGVYPVNNVLGLTQAVWDVRRLLQWLRVDQEAPAVGVLGLSLGSYVCGLLSTVEPDLACVVALVPTGDLASALREARPSVPSRRRLHDALHDERSTLVHRVVSPLARPPLVPRDRRFIVAGTVDQVAPPAGAAALWRHWDRPSILWRDRGHVTTAVSAEYDAYIDEVLTARRLVREVAVS